MQDALFDVEEPLAASWVYVIGAANSSIVKIGITDGSIPKRLGEIQTSNPERLVIRWGVAGSRTLEKGLHREFKHLRLTGEWFDFGSLDPVEEIRSAVERLLPGMELQVYGHARRHTLYPADRDPHRHDPAYQPNEFGCRRLTPAEHMASGSPTPAPGMFSYWCAAHCGAGECFF